MIRSRFFAGVMIEGKACPVQPEELRKSLSGIVGISITPFHKDGSLDLAGYAKNLDFVVAGGLDASRGVLVVGGSTGECGAMDKEERAELVAFAVKHLGERLPVVAGCNSTNISEAQWLAGKAEEAGAAGIMSLPPYYYPPKDPAAILGYYKELANSTSLGILLYNNLEVQGLDVPLDVIDVLADIPNVVGIKDCSHSFFKLSRTVERCGDRLAVINGHGEFLEPFAGLAGTAGFISSIVNFAPGLAANIWDLRKEGRYTEAKTVRDHLLPYMDLASVYSAQGGEYKVIALLKEAADLVGSAGGFGRTPVSSLTEDERTTIRTTVSACGLL